MVELSFPDMEVVRTLPLFTAKEHINTLAMFDDEHLLVVLHNLGKVHSFVSVPVPACDCLPPAFDCLLPAFDCLLPPFRSLPGVRP